MDPSTEEVHIAKYAIGILIIGRDVNVIQKKFFPELRESQMRVKIYDVERIVDAVFAEVSKLDCAPWVKCIIKGVYYMYCRALGSYPTFPMGMQEYEEVLNMELGELRIGLISFLEETFDLTLLFSRA